MAVFGQGCSTTGVRKHLVCAADTPYFHISARCVRPALLCGTHRYSGKSYEHRRDWIDAGIRVLSSLFSIDLHACAVLSSHYHLVVKLDSEQAVHWSDGGVLKRWTSPSKGTLLVQRHIADANLCQAGQDSLQSTAAIYRQR